MPTTKNRANDVFRQLNERRIGCLKGETVKVNLESIMIDGDRFRAVDGKLIDDDTEAHRIERITQAVNAARHVEGIEAIEANGMCFTFQNGEIKNVGPSKKRPAISE